MKKVLYAWSAFIVAVVIISISSIPAFAGSRIRISLEKVGEIPESVLSGKEIDVFPTGLIAEDEDHKFYILDEMGNNNLGRSYDHAKAFTEELFLVYDAENWPNSCGLVKADGTVVLPCEAAIIQTIKETDRYLKISVATEPTDKENAFIYTYSGWIAWPTEQSEYYDGYSQYYDLKEAKYFENWEDADPGDIHGGYTKASGENSTTVIFDPEGNEVASLDFSPSEIYGEGELFSKRTDDGFIVVDRKGDPINDIVFKASPTETNGYLRACDVRDDNVYTVMDFSGKVYADGTDHVRNVSRMPYGFLSLGKQDGNDLLLYPDGTIAETGDHTDDGATLPFFIRGRDGKPDRIFVLNKGIYIDTETDFVSKLDSSSSLLRVKLSGDDDYSLISAADGSILLKNGGSKIIGSDYRVYALKDGAWTVYKVTTDY